MIGKRTRRVEVVAERVGSRSGCGLGRRLDVMQKLGEVHRRRPRLHEPVSRPVDRLAIVRPEHGEAHDQAVPLVPAEFLLVEQLMNGDEVAERLRHLLAFHLQEAVVQPEVRHHRRAGAQRDCAISFS